MHSTWLLTAATVGVGLILIVKVVAAPVHPFAEGVTVIVAVVGAAPVLTAVKLAISPRPAAAKPIEVLSLVQLNCVPTTVPVNSAALVVAPLHSTWLATAATVGVGFTVMVNVLDVPVHPAADGVTVIVEMIGDVPVLVAVKLAISPLPEAAKPIEVLSLVQLYRVPPTAPVKLTAAVAALLQITWLATAAMVGIGFTVMVAVVEYKAEHTPLWIAAL